MRHRLPAYALGAVLLVAGAGALAQAEAERRLDAAIARLRAALPPEMRLEIGARQVDPVTGRAVLTNVVLTDGQGRLHVPELRLADVTETRLGNAEAAGITLRTPEGGTGEIGRIALAGLPVPVEGKSLNLGNMSLDALQVEGARLEDPSRGAIRLGRLEIRGLRPDAVEAAAVQGFEFRGAPQDAQFARLGLVELQGVILPLDSGAPAPARFRAARIAIEGAELRDQGQGVAVALGRLALQDWLPGRPATLAVEGVQLASPAGSYGQIEVSLARLDAGGIDAPRTLEAVLGGLQIPDPFPGRPQHLRIEGLDAAWDGQPVFTLARLASEGAMEGGIATGALTAEGMRVTPPRGQAAWLEMIGYREIAGGLEIRGRVPRAGGRLEIAPFRIAWNEAATLVLEAQIDDAPPTPPEGAAVDPNATAALFASARLAGVTLALRDHGLLGRVLSSQARQQRVPEARLREQWAQMVMAMPVPGAAPPAPRRGAAPPAKGPQAGAADPLAPMRQALASFIRQPGTLELTVRPPKAVPFAELATLGGSDPAQTVERLGIRLVAR